MSLAEAYTGVQVLEAVANYATADESLRAPQGVAPAREPAGGTQYFDAEDEMWGNLLRSSQVIWGTRFFFAAALPEWVVCVPRLYWTPGSDTIRRLSPQTIEATRGNWTFRVPWAKSQVVPGGMGTLRLPPAAAGTRLMTLTGQFNASAGVPALVKPAVWDKICSAPPCQTEGRHLTGAARWQPMAAEWASNFPSTRGIPRGYLVLDDPDAVEVGSDIAPIQIRPFTIMEDQSGARELFDFCMGSALTSEPGYRDDVAAFFDIYKIERERYGRYLVAGDMVELLWDTEFDSPADLRRTNPVAQSQLELIEARVRERLLGGDTIDRLLEALGTVATSAADLQRLSNDALIPPAVWYHGRMVTEAAGQLVDEALRQNKLAALSEVVACDYPAVARKET